MTPCGPAMLVIILCTNAPNLIQTLANLGITPARVYVRNNSTAHLSDAYSYYNVSVAGCPNALSARGRPLYSGC